MEKQVIGLMLASGLVFTLASGKEVKADTLKANQYQISAKLDTKKRVLTQTVTMTVTNSGKAALKEVVVVNPAKGYLAYDRTNYAASVKKGATSQIQMAAAGKRKLQYSLGKNSSVKVKLAAPLKTGGKTKLTFKVKTAIPKRDDRFGYSKLKKGSLYNLSFCWLYLAKYQNGKWLTHPYTDNGENRYNAVSNYTVTFKAPKSYVVAANGNAVTKNGVTKIKAANVRDLAIAASDQYRVKTFKASGITVKSYYLPGRYAGYYNEVVKRVAGDAIKLYTSRFGKYPYRELSLTESLFGVAFGGMEFPGLAMINGSSIYTAKKKSDCDFLAIQEDVAHEAAHQWFYGTVGNDEYAEGWLDEGFATYFATVDYGIYSNLSSISYVNKLAGYSEKKFATYKQEYAEDLAKSLKLTKKSYVNRSMAYWDKTGSGTGNYDQGSLFLAELRSVMGDAKFFAAMKEYYQTYYLKEATTKGFLAIIAKHDNSQAVQAVISKFIK